MPSLYDLPDEVLLEVVRGLEAIRSFENQSEAFRGAKQEKARQCENHIRQQTLHALCLASHRLRYLSLPTLYSSFLTCATRHGYSHLQLLHRTILDAENALVQTKHVARHTRYIETRLADFRGESLQDDATFQQNSIGNYFQLLATVALCAPNLEHLCVVSIEHDDVSFWAHVVDNVPRYLQPALAKLKHLSIQFHAYPSSTLQGVPTTQRVLQHLQLLPLLSDLWISSASSNIGYASAFRSIEFSNLLRLDLTVCSLELVDVADLLLGCKSLQHFACRWQWVNDTQVGPSVLHPTLLVLANSLKTLALDWRAIRHRILAETQDAMIGSLKSLHNLRSLEVCELGFLSDFNELSNLSEQQPGPKISDLLPEGLAHMTLLVSTGYGQYDSESLEESTRVIQFSNDCKDSLPSLKTLCIKAKKTLSLPSLTSAFARAGVELRSEIDL